MKHTTTIPPKVPALIQDYLAGESTIEPFCSGRPDLSHMVSLSKQRSLDPAVRATLVEVLKEQAAASAYATKAAQANIDRLSSEDSRTVVTGHQLCIYGGPMFFPYKILSAIKLARSLEEKGVQAVPVYWMASEDHDFKEVNHFWIGEKRILWERESGGPVGAMKLKGIEAVQRELQDIFQDDPLREETLHELEKIYDPRKTLAEATRDLVYWLFGHYGIVVIDAADARLKKIFRPVMERELKEQPSIAAVTNTTNKLFDAGYGGQVTPRNINLFWMEDDFRERIVVNKDGFGTPDGERTWSEEEMMQALQEHPERFSPNVVLRPVYQECILPNVAYIGGPGELSYWLQLKSVFDDFEVPFPAIVLRDMAVILDQKTAKRKDQLGLNIDHVYGDQEEIFKEMVREEGTHEYLVSDLEETFSKRLGQLVSDLENFDATMGESAKAERKRILNRLEVLRKKVLRADKRRHETTERRLSEFLAQTYPNKTPQERVYSWMMYTHSDARTSFFDRLIEAFDPLKPGLKVFEE